MAQIKTSKRCLSSVIKYINEHHIKLDNEISKHLKILIGLWNNDKNADMEYYYNMKVHHSHINGQISDPILTDLWNGYIQSGSLLRVTMLKMTHLMSCSDLFLENETQPTS